MTTYWQRLLFAAGRFIWLQVILAAGFIVIRLFETALFIYEHGLPEEGARVIFSGFASDLIFVTLQASLFFPLFACLYLGCRLLALGV